MLTLDHGYQKSACMVGVAYQTAMSGLEGAAKMTGGLVLLNSLSAANDSVQSPELWLAVATLNMAVQVHLLNTQLRSNPKLVEQLRQQQQPPSVQI